MAKRILAVDDSRAIRSMISLTLMQAGFEVVEAANGAEALEHAGSHPMDAIITDLNMPTMNGIALIQALREHPSYRSTPILILTIENDVAKKKESTHAGATAWMVKPFTPHALVRLVKKLCKE